MSLDKANVVVHVPGRYEPGTGQGRITGHAVVELDPALPAGAFVTRLVEVRLFGQPPRLAAGRLRCPFWLEFCYQVAGLDAGAEVQVAGVEVHLVSTVPPAMPGPAWIDRRRTACSGGCLSRDRRSLLARLELAVGLGPPAPVEEEGSLTWISSPQSDPPTLQN